MRVLQEVTKESLEKFVSDVVTPKSVLITDKNTAYYNLERLVEDHGKVKSSPDSTKGDLNWVHVAISNLKKNLL
ncbi:ISXO2-like transposase domain-containing protein [Belliella pelovolcani]|uniref:ISXO2-like transposase domain-containing protein n=1 Tax=Belliella pelovolcani TaxID=529505 RepID=A0A1N7KHJ9_9BACT|nr:ISXO2-like transposase domain-containing protein [Belliella pelovolcani]